jgi:hypothetical protein
MKNWLQLSPVCDRCWHKRIPLIPRARKQNIRMLIRGHTDFRVEKVRWCVRELTSMSGSQQPFSRDFKGAYHQTIGCNGR